MNREPAFPIHPCCYSIEQTRTESMLPGRIILSHYQPHTGVMDPEIIDLVGPHDVVFIPLYGGGPTSLRLGDRWLTHDIDDRIGAYADNIEIMKEIAPRVRAILVGNAGPEMSFKESWRADEDRIVISMRAAEFVKRTGDMILSFGGRPAYGTVDWDIAIDCYYGAEMLRLSCMSEGAIQIVFCGFHLFDLLNPETQDVPVPHPSDAMFWRICPTREEGDKPRLTDYLRRTPDIWTGLSTQRGLRRGFDTVLHSHGFDEGVMGSES